MPIYQGVDGVVKKNDSLSIGVNGVSKLVNSGWIGQRGVRSKFYNELASTDIAFFVCYLYDMYIYKLTSSLTGGGSFSRDGRYLYSKYLYKDGTFNTAKNEYGINVSFINNRTGTKLGTANTNTDNKMIEMQNLADGIDFSISPPSTLDGPAYCFDIYFSIYAVLWDNLINTGSVYRYSPPNLKNVDYYDIFPQNGKLNRFFTQDNYNSGFTTSFEIIPQSCITSTSTYSGIFLPLIYGFSASSISNYSHNAWYTHDTINQLTSYDPFSMCTMGVCANKGYTTNYKFKFRESTIAYSNSSGVTIASVPCIKLNGISYPILWDTSTIADLQTS